ncbi:ribose import ATP-binding protein RbsA [Pseudoclavibacter endophyticus]|uniref:Sugar ABC transporter ATP-binding protein n=1 Tax=Pseudoclavibacter endophyticus TaxID=1778590 RepID=A0A6H9WBQ0_9MICO|nr:sugar ABC transporter ATP-binding protein [Pseudoclavibacter endophyticus]KAB1648080.1 sugar ABC transporter ATP-binding protein [Pseudoclavibacter endophyticus]GGA69508.1 ribose import ATP-binding protein RbsA [Pseudoclavibacter endophyticus]
MVPALEANGIVKRFDGVLALDNAHLDVLPGEIHALLGENGAGKSTLIRALTGVLPPDAGEISRDGEHVSIPNVRAANHAGIVALYQEISIIPSMTVAENIVLGERTPAAAGFVDWRRLHAEANRQLARLNQRIPLGRLAGALPPVKQTMVAIARALATDARVLILDEPTASLTDTEIRDLFETLRRLRAEGVAIVYVSHRLDEVFELCDRLTVMRNGRTIVTRTVAETTIDEVISTMVGRRADTMYPDRGTATSREVLRVEGLSGHRVVDASFSVNAGEVLGIGGLAGSGRSELLRLIAGAQKRTAGRVLVDEEPVGRFGGVGRALNAGIALVPEERRSQGVVLNRSIQDNIAFANLGALSRIGWMSQRAVAELARTGLANFQVKARGPGQPVGQLSGGNQQKVVLAKMLARQPKVLLMDEPTRGIDVGTKAEIYRLIRQLAANGTTVIAVSSELPELIGLSDRIMIMHEGRIAGSVGADGADDEQLLAYAYGRVTDDRH